MPELMQAQTRPSFRKWIVSLHLSAIFTDPESALFNLCSAIDNIAIEEQQTCSLAAAIAQHVGTQNTFASM